MICKVDGNLQLDSRDWNMYSSCLTVQLTEDPFPQNRLSNLRLSCIRRYADKFRQKCQIIENSRHIVIKRERIGLNLSILFNEVKSMVEHAGIRHCASEIVGGKEC